MAASFFHVLLAAAVAGCSSAAADGAHGYWMSHMAQLQSESMEWTA